MILVTPELRKRLLANGRRRGLDHVPVVKFFNPLGIGTWLATELDEDGDTLFGLADLGYPPSPCGRLSRPRTTMRAPTPPRAFAGRFGHPSPRGAGRAPKFHRCSLSALGADSTPCRFRPPGLAGFPGC